MMTCTHSGIKKDRKDLLGKRIRMVYQELKDVVGIEHSFRDINGVTDKTKLIGVVAVYLVGGTVNGYCGCSYTYGFGQCELLPIGADTHGYVYTSLFLAKAARRYVTRLGLEVYENPQDLRMQDMGDAFAN